MADRWYEIENGLFVKCSQKDGMAFLKDPDCGVEREVMCTEEEAKRLYPDKYARAIRRS